MTFASQISREINPCNEILNSGSEVYMHLLDFCEATPQTEQIVVDATITVIATTANLRLATSTYSPQTLRAGSVLYFSNPDTSIVLSEEVILTDIAQTVNIDQPPTVQIDAAEALNFYINSYKLVSPTDIPFNLSAGTQERIDYSSVQGGVLKDTVNLDMNITSIATLTDQALWNVVFESAKTLKFTYVAVFDTAKKSTFGKSLIDSYAENGQIDEVKRPNFNIKFLNGDYSMFAPFDRLGVVDQGLVNDERSKLLLARY